jgi:hypothetical protein
MRRKELGERTGIQERGAALHGRGRDLEHGAEGKIEYRGCMACRDGKKKQRYINIIYHDMSSLISVEPEKEAEFMFCVLICFLLKKYGLLFSCDKCATDSSQKNIQPMPMHDSCVHGNRKNSSLIGISVN